jgi:predicted peptidase
MLKIIKYMAGLLLIILPFVQAIASSEQLLRERYTSQQDRIERDFFVYLPADYHQQPNKKWPVLLFLHGNGERGNGKDELDFVLSHGPLYEAWVQKKPLPFIIISPQLHMYDFRKIGYIANRSKDNIPKRLAEGVPPRNADFATPDAIERLNSLTDMSKVDPLLPKGWETVEQDLINILALVKQKYHTDNKRIYLSGLSYGGFGTWYMASQYPTLFAAIVPVVGWGHPSLMPPIAQHQVPVWAFAGGRDQSIKIEHFYAGLNTLEQLGHNDVRFTVHEDMGHDTWTRVYASSDLYQWLLSHQIK